MSLTAIHRSIALTLSVFLCTSGWCSGPARAAETIWVEAENLHAARAMVDAAFVADAHARGRNVWAWTANAPVDIATLVTDAERCALEDGQRHEGRGYREDQRAWQS